MITDVKILTKEDRDTIAEFIYSYQTDVLIIPDCIHLVEVLIKHNLIVGREGWMADINNQKPDIADKIWDRLCAKLSRDVVESIMKEYHGQ